MYGLVALLSLSIVLSVVQAYCLLHISKVLKQATRKWGINK
jgi:hypothetical protein